jgi:hypothetical protein
MRVHSTIGHDSTALHTEIPKTTPAAFKIASRFPHYCLQAAMANAAVCRGVSATGRRLLHKQKVKATVDQRLLDMIDSYKKHWDAAARTTNDTDQISFMATRKVRAHTRYSLFFPCVHKPGTAVMPDT